ncbi:MAG: HAMP domain-containing protein [Pyrinomonadaceae bacterium]|nr:HAMP domain-containing protein [Pyrinomonadaceae bacterium]
MKKVNKLLEKFGSVRWRLTLWFTFALAVALSIFSVTVYFAMRQSLNSQLETALYDGTLALADNLDHEFEEGDAVQLAADSVALESSFRNLAVEIYAPNQSRIAASSDFLSSNESQNLDLESFPQWTKGATNQAIINTRFDTENFKIAAIRVVHYQTKEIYTIVVGARKSAINNELAILKNLLLTLAPLLLILSASGGFYLAKRALKPVATMTAQARLMNANKLSERLAVAHPNDELGHLASTFNELFDRIEKSFGQMRQFIADASHELRTPVTVIRSETEVALTEPRDETEAFASLAIIRDESIRLSRLVEDMFALARADADEQISIVSEDVFISEIVETCARAAETLGRSRDVLVTLENDLPKNTICIGDKTRIAQMLLNLLDNATKYTPVGGLVTIKANVDENYGTTNAIISITDNGSGDNIAALLFDITAVQSRLCPMNRPCHFSIKVLTNSGHTYTPETGVIFGKMAVARRSS